MKMVPCVRCGKTELIECIRIGEYEEILFMANCINRSCTRYVGYWVTEVMLPERVAGYVLIEEEHG